MNVSSAREMNDSSAAITERKPQRPCGCVGIFFQLFDRNRRFAKKLFPKKLLSPACLKQASKKFGGDEKQPKLRLIADENSGGFPNAKNNGMTNTRCESKRKMKAPSLVARLMGLELMPAGSGSKPQKASASETWSNVADKLGARPGGSDKEDMDLEMAEIMSLEPGLRRFKAKCALTYPTRYFSPLEDEADLAPHLLKSPNPCVDSNILKGTSVPSRKNCGYFLHSKNGTPNVEEYSSFVSSPVSSDSGPPCEGPGRNMPRLPIFSSRDQLERVSEGSSSDATAEIDDVSYCAELILGKRSTSRTRMEMHGTRQRNNVKKDASSVTHVVNQKQNQTAQNRERGLMKSKPSSLQSNSVLAAAESMNNTQRNKRPSRNEDLCDDGDVSSRNTCMNFQDMQLFPVVNCNSLEDFNLAFRLSHNGFQELRHEAALAVTCINKCGYGGFEELFITKIDFPTRYDYCVRLNLRGNREVSSLGYCLDDECWRSQEQKVLSLMDQGLRDRSKSVRVIWRNTSSECNFEKGLSELDNEPLLIGISVSSAEAAFKMTVIGPSPEERDKALEFRKFWGDKTSLRQFRDSRIAEVAVWEHEEWQRHLIIKDIAEHVLSRHLSIPKEKIVPIVDQLDFCLLHRDVDPISFSKSLLVALEELSKRLLQLKDIPLKVSTVQALDSAVRLTSVFPPMPHPLAHEKGVDIKPRKPVSTCINPVEVMIQLEGSGNWPMDEIAIEKTKTAFLLRIAESLQNSWGMMFSATEDDVDVLMSCYAFRLKISHERALSLVTGQSNNSRHQWSLSADRQLLLRHQHASKINALRGRYPIYGPIVRLAKRWVSAHLFFTGHFNNVSGVLSKIDQLKRSKLSYAKQIIFNTEVIFGTTPQQQALPVEDGSSVSYFLLNEHEMFSSLLWMTFGQLLGCNDPKQMNQLKGFAFDCLLDYRDSKFARYYDSGFRTCTKLPSSMTKEILIDGVIEEVEDWTEFLDLNPDELIEWEPIL